MRPLNFAIFVGGDAYTTEKKIMGRQSAGQAMIGGLVRKWPSGTVHAFGSARSAGRGLADQLAGQGFEGTVRWRGMPGDSALDELGAVYYPAPVPTRLAFTRNARGPSGYSLFGVTHTLASEGAMDQVAALALPPFKPWDALICTSQAALQVVTRLQDEMRGWQARHTGATRFSDIQLPVIPLGVDAPAYAREAADVRTARAALELGEDEVAFLFAGRLTFHAKANPSALYQALERAAPTSGKRLVCIEAGVYPNTGTFHAFEQARAAMAPSVRFISVDGADLPAYRQAWQAADVFASLSDNIQETFGLTPLEAMAAGMPVLVSDWNGYKDTVRDGVDGFRVPVTLPMAGTGLALAERHALGIDSYDYFIGRASMSTVIDIDALVERIETLAVNADMRRRMGEAGRVRARNDFDWPVILDRYVELAETLSAIRRSAPLQDPEPWPFRPDPFSAFAGYPTSTLSPLSTASPRGSSKTLDDLLELEITKYAFVDPLLTADTVRRLHRELAAAGDTTIGDLMAASVLTDDQTVLALMWLAKFDVARIRA